MLRIAATPMRSRTNAVIRVSETGKTLSPWMSLPARIDFAQMAQPQHELNVVGDAESEHHDTETDKASPKLRGAAALVMIS